MQFLTKKFFYYICKDIEINFLIMRKTFLFALISVIFFKVYSQNENHKSIHQLESEYYEALGYDYSYFEKINTPTPINDSKSSKTCNIQKIVFGWHPYWANGKEANYQWNLLSDLCYFSYEVNPNTGNAITTNGWATANAVTQALANGVRVSLCVTLFSDHATFFANSSAQQTLITNLINLVQSRGAHGVNIDFEGVPSSQKTAFNNFVINLCTQFHSQIPGSKVSLCLYAVDWSDVFDEVALNPHIDYFTIMGYDYYYSGSSVAGPTAPLYTFNTFNYNLARTVNYYLSQGISKEKLVLGLPYYGMEWNTTSSTVPSSTTSYVGSRTYKTIKDNTSGNYSNKQWDNTGICPYYVYYSSNWRQCFVDDEESLGIKYDFVNMMGIAGIGIWALSYDDGYTQLWNLIRDKFSDCATVPCSGTFYDLGGPYKDYLNNSNYNFTIAPTGASKVILNFPEFDVEAGSGSTCNYDYVEIFDGPSTASPSLGRFCNTTGNPGTIISTGNTLTVKVYTDGATVKSGFKGEWSCIMDNIPPETQIIAEDWQKQNFTVLFNDTDNDAVDLKFYQVLDFNGSEWRANGNYGFFNDNFNSTIHPEWSNLSGTWTINNGALSQTDESLSNNNIYATINQQENYIYLFHWKMKLSGSGTNRRAGLYIFCSQPELSQRGNAYMIYFRVDDNKCQIYRCTDNSIVLKTDDDTNVDANVWYDYKVIYNPQTGVISAYQNNVLVSTWTDPNPLTSGIAISLRTGGCVAEYDDIKVYKTRSNTVNVSVGTNSEVRYENPNPSIPACQINTIITDLTGNFSDLYSKYINIDRTAPQAVLYVNDGAGSDIDITYNGTSLSANWGPAIETNSYVTKYEYCVGTTPGANNVIDWNDVGTNLSFYQSGLNLVSGTTYYTSVRATNIVNLVSNVNTSNGVLYINPADLTIAAFSYSQTTVCPGTPIYFYNESVNASSYQWQITGPENYSSTETNPSFVLQPGTYQVQLTAFGSLGNDVQTANITITQIALPQNPTSVNASNTSICTGNSTTLTYTGGSGDNFAWYANSCGTNQIGTGNNFIVTPTQSTTYFGRWENQCGYSDCMQIDISVMNYPENAETISAQPQQVCSNNSTILSFTGGSGDNFYWYTDNCGENLIGTGNNFVVQPTQNTVYFGRWENSCGYSECSQIGIFMIQNPEEAVSIFANPQQICDDGSTMLSFVGGYGTNFVWYNDECGGNIIGTGNNLIIQPNQNTTFFGRWENQCGVSNCKQISVVHSNSPLADFYATETALYLPNAIAYFVNNSQNADYYYWDFGDGNFSLDANPSHQYQIAGSFTVYLTAYNNICGQNTKTIEDYITVNSSSTITTQIENSQILISPIPAKDFIHINSKEKLITRIEIVTTTGQILYSVKVNALNASINVFDMQPAVYYLNIYTPEEFTRQKILVIK
jgi:spore germination protein YaaH/PKD repeat protein